MKAGTGDDRARSAELFRGAAQVVAEWPDVWQRLLTEHVAGPHGACRECPIGLHGGTRWPCGLHALGVLAREYAAPQLARRGPRRRRRSARALPGPSPLAGQ